MNAVDILNLPHPQTNFSIHTLRKHHPTDCQIDPKHYGFHVKRFTIKEHKIQNLQYFWSSYNSQIPDLINIRFKGNSAELKLKQQNKQK